MYQEVILVPYTLGSTAAFLMFRKTAAGDFLWFFLRFFLYIRKKMS